MKENRDGAVKNLKDQVAVFFDNCKEGSFEFMQNRGLAPAAIMSDLQTVCLYFSSVQRN